MKMEQIMECLVAKIDSNQEQTKVGQEQMRAKMKADQEQMRDEMETIQENIQANQHKMANIKKKYGGSDKKQPRQDGGHNKLHSI
jgi:predicted  nucleic acid-binding Zn-ribbon protein